MRRFILILMLVLIPAAGFWVVWPSLSGWRINEALKAGDAAALAAKIDFDRVRVSLRPAATAEAEKRLGEALAKAGPGGAAFAEDLKKQLLPRIVDGALATLVTPDNLIRLHRDGGAVKDILGRMVGEEVGKGGAGLGGLLSGLGGAATGGGAAGGVGRPAGAGGALLDKLGGLVGGRASPVRDITGEAGAAAPQPPAAARPSPVRDITAEEGGAGASKPAVAAPAAPATKAAPAAPEKPSYGLANVKTWGLNGPLGVYVGVARDATAKEPDVTAELSFTGGDWKLTGLRPRM